MKKAPHLSDVPSARNQRGCLAVFFSIFLLAGCGVVWMATVKPTLGVIMARGWVERTALVLSSEIQEHDGDGTTYSPAIRYSFRVDGAIYESTRHDFYGGSTSRLAEVRGIVARYPEGAEVPCFVNPANPREAVLNRDFQSRGWFGLFGLIFVAVGAGGIAFALGHGKDVSRERPSAGPLTLKPSASPRKNFWITLFVTLFWNGFIALFSWLAYTSEESMPFFAKAVLAVFGGIGILMLWGVVSGFKKLFWPVPHLTLPRGQARLGRTDRIEWRFTGRAGTIRSLSIVMEGREEAQFRQGTDTLTETSLFYRKDILSTADPLRIPAGGEDFAVPPHLVPSLTASSNKIIWLFRVVAGTDGSDRIEAEFPFPVAAQGGDG